MKKKSFFKNRLLLVMVYVKCRFFFVARGVQLDNRVTPTPGWQLYQWSSWKNDLNFLVLQCKFQLPKRWRDEL